MQTIIWYFVVISTFTYLIYDTYKDGGWQETVKFLIIFGALFLSIRTFLIQPFVVEGPSMSPTFETNNYLLVNKLSMYFTDLERYDIVIFDIPNSQAEYHSCFIKLPFTNSCLWTGKRYLIKRIIGLPGEKVEVINGVTTIYNKENLKGVLLRDDYVMYPSPLSSEVTLSNNEYFVMGDNRANSKDSRYFGAVNQEKIVGIPLFRLFPFNQINIYPGALEVSPDLNLK